MDPSSSGPNRADHARTSRSRVVHTSSSPLSYPIGSTPNCHACRRLISVSTAGTHSPSAGAISNSVSTRAATSSHCSRSSLRAVVGSGKR
mgnify:CR=1 FL=1